MSLYTECPITKNKFSHFIGLSKCDSINFKLNIPLSEIEDFKEGICMSKSLMELFLLDFFTKNHFNLGCDIGFVLPFDFIQKCSQISKKEFNLLYKDKIVLDRKFILIPYLRGYTWYLIAIENLHLNFTDELKSKLQLKVTQKKDTNPKINIFSFGNQEYSQMKKIKQMVVYEFEKFLCTFIKFEYNMRYESSILEQNLFLNPNFVSFKETQFYQYTEALSVLLILFESFHDDQCVERFIRHKYHLTDNFDKKIDYIEKDLLEVLSQYLKDEKEAVYNNTNTKENSSNDNQNEIKKSVRNFYMPRPSAKSALRNRSHFPSPTKSVQKQNGRKTISPSNMNKKTNYNLMNRLNLKQEECNSQNTTSINDISSIKAEEEFPYRKTENNPYKKLNLLTPADRKKKEKQEDLVRRTAMGMRPKNLGYFRETETITRPNYREICCVKKTQKEPFEKNNSLSFRNKILKLEPDKFEIISETAYGLSKKYPNLSQSPKAVDPNLLNRAYSKLVFNNNSPKKEIKSEHISSRRKSDREKYCKLNHSSNFVAKDIPMPEEQTGLTPYEEVPEKAYKPDDLPLFLEEPSEKPRLFDNSLVQLKHYSRLNKNQQIVAVEQELSTSTHTVKKSRGQMMNLQPQSGIESENDLLPQFNRIKGNRRRSQTNVENIELTVAKMNLFIPKQEKIATEEDVNGGCCKDKCLIF